MATVRETFIYKRLPKSLAVRYGSLPLSRENHATSSKCIQSNLTFSPLSTQFPVYKVNLLNNVSVTENALFHDTVKISAVIGSHLSCYPKNALSKVKPGRCLPDYPHVVLLSRRPVPAHHSLRPRTACYVSPPPPPAHLGGKQQGGG